MEPCKVTTIDHGRKLYLKSIYRTCGWLHRVIVFLEALNLDSSEYVGLYVSVCILELSFYLLDVNAASAGFSSQVAVLV